MRDDTASTPSTADGADHVILRSTAEFDLLAEQAPAVAVHVELRYDTRDPFAVTAAFRTGRAGWVEWVFARDLLADGLLDDTGNGDVRVRPGIEDPEIVSIELDSPSGYAVFHAGTQRLIEFLDSTYDVVMPGRETRWTDVVDELDQLLTRDQRG